MPSSEDMAHKKSGHEIHFDDTKENSMKLDEIAHNYSETIDLFMKLRSRHNNTPPLLAGFWLCMKALL